MNNTTITELYHKLIKLDHFSEPLAKNYEDDQDDIAIGEEMGSYKKTIRLEKKLDVYIQVHELDDEQHMKSYAVGVEEERKNHIRFDNRDHHNGLANPPHHKHVGHKEQVKDFSGEVNDLVTQLDDICKKLRGVC